MRSVYFAAAIFLASTLAASGARAYYCRARDPNACGFTPTGGSSPASDDSPGSADNIGDPVQVGTGWAYHRERLFSAPAGGGLMFDFMVEYESAGWEDSTSQDFGTFNPGWTDSLDVTMTNDGTLGGFWAIKDEIGGQHAFTNTPILNVSTNVYDPLDEQNYTTLTARTDGGYDWTREDGTVWTFGAENCAASGQPETHCLVQIADRTGANKIVIQRSSTAPYREITSITLPTYGETFDFSYVNLGTDPPNDGLSTVTEVVGANQFPVAAFTYDSQVLSGFTDAGGYSLLSYDPTTGSLATVDRQTSSTSNDPVRLVKYTWNTSDLVGTLKDRNNDLDFTYDSNDGDTTVTDNTQSGPPSAKYYWTSYGTGEFIRVYDIEPDATYPMHCVHCNRGVSFEFDRRINRAAVKNVHGQWTTYLYDDDQVIWNGANNSTATVTTGQPDVLYDPSADFTGANPGDTPVQPGDVFRWLRADGTRNCLVTPAPGRLCDDDNDGNQDENIVAQVIDQTHVQLDSTVDTGAKPNYWIVREKRYDNVINGTNGSIKTRHLLENSASDPAFTNAGIQAGDEVDVLDVNSNVVATVYVDTDDAMDPRWLSLTGSISGYGQGGYGYRVLDGSGTTITTGAVYATDDEELLYDPNENFQVYAAPNDQIDVGGGVLPAPVTTLDSSAAFLSLSGIPEGTYPSYNIQRSRDSYAAKNGGRVLRAVENNMRWNGTSCVADPDPWTEDTAHCQGPGLSEVTTYEYDNAVYPNLVTAIERPSIVAGQTTSTIYDYNPNPSIATANITCSDPPSDFGVPLGTQNAGLLRRKIEIGWTNDSTFTSACTVRVTTYTYSTSAPYELLSITGPLGTSDVTQYGYGTDGYLSTIKRYTDSTHYLETQLGAAVTGCSASGYNPVGRPQTVIDPNGVGWCLGWDLLGRLTSVQRADAASGWTLSYDQSNNLVSVVDPTGTTTQRAFAGGRVGDLAGGFLSAASRSTPSGTLLSETFLTYPSDSGGDLNTPTSVKTASRIPTEGVDCSADADCLFSGMTCNTNVQPNVCAPKSCTQTSDCSADGSELCLGPTGAKACMLVSGLTEYGYDIYRRVDALKTHRTSYTVGSPDATRTWTRDPDGRVESVQEENQTSPNVWYTYDAQGNLTEIDRAIGGTRTKLVAYTYDLQGDLASVTYYDGSTGAQRSQTTYTYDDFGELLKVVSPDAGTVQYAYDAAGNVSKKLDAVGNTIAYAYDDASRLTGITYPHDTAVTRTYDGAEGTPALTDCKTGVAITWPANRYGTGRVTKIADSIGTHYFSYDADGHVIDLYDARKTESCARVWSYSYDSDGRLSSQVYADGREVDYSYDGLDQDRPGSIRAKRQINGNWETDTIVQSINYGAGGELGAVLYGNGTGNLYQWFLDGSPEGRTTYGSTGKLDEREVTSTNALGYPTAVSGMTDATSETYQYDPDLHELTQGKVDSYTSGTSPYDEEDFNYETTLLGDRTKWSDVDPTTPGLVHNETTTRAPGSSRFTELEDEDTLNGVPQQDTDQKVDFVMNSAGAPSSMTFSAYQNGTWVNEGGNTFDYDDAGRLKDIYPGGGGARTYSYDYDDLRTAASWGVNNARDDFYYERNGELDAHLGCGDSTCTWDATHSRPVDDYIWLNGEPIALLSAALPPTGTEDDTNGGIYYINDGLLGEPRTATDQSGNVVWEFDTKPFGQMQGDAPEKNSDNLDLDLRFPEAPAALSRLRRPDRRGNWFNQLDGGRAFATGSDGSRGTVARGQRALVDLACAGQRRPPSAPGFDGISPKRRFGPSTRLPPPAHGVLSHLPPAHIARNDDPLDNHRRSRSAAWPRGVPASGDRMAPRPTVGAERHPGGGFPVDVDELARQRDHDRLLDHPRRVERIPLALQMGTGQPEAASRLAHPLRSRLQPPPEPPAHLFHHRRRGVRNASAVRQTVEAPVAAAGGLPPGGGSRLSGDLRGHGQGSDHNGVPHLHPGPPGLRWNPGKGAQGGLSA